LFGGIKEIAFGMPSLNRAAPEIVSIYKKISKKKEQQIMRKKVSKFAVLPVNKVRSFSPSCQKCGLSLVKNDYGLWVCPIHGTDFD